MKATAEEIEMMLESGFTVELDKRIGHRFVRNEYRVWPIVKRDEDQHYVGMRWQTAKLVNGYFTAHQPYDTLKEVVEAIVPFHHRACTLV